jgi:glycosyltransferase involved in cell wall biosynthesis/O-antigen/teichoic acid export membrane protein
MQSVAVKLPQSRLARTSAWVGQARSDPLVKNSFYLLLTTATMGVLGFVFWALSARLFNPGQIGVATTLISATSLISYLSLLGFNTTFVSFLPGSRDRDAEISTGLLLVFGAGLLVALVYILAVPSFVPQLHFARDSIIYAGGFVLLTAFAAVNLVTDSIFIAYREARYNFLIDGLIQGGSKLALPLALVGLGAYGIFAASGVAAFVAVVLSIYFMIRSLRYRPQLRVSRDVIRRVSRFSAPNYVANVLNIVPIMVVPLIVIHSLGASEAGYYYLTFQLTNLVNAVTYAVSQSLLAEGSYDGTDLGVLARRSAGLQALVMVPAVAFLCLASSQVLFVFGPAYSHHARGALIVLSLATLAVALNTWTTSLLRLKRQLSLLVWRNVVFVAVITGLSVLWVHRGLAWVSGAWLVGNLLAGVVAGVALVLSGRRESAMTAENQGEVGRTVMIVTPYFPPEGGGLEAYAATLADLLVKGHGWRVVVVTSGCQRRGVRQEETRDIRVYRLPSQLRISNTRFGVTWRRQLRRIIRFEAPILINAHAPVPGLADLAAGQAKDIPLVVTYHTGSMRKGRWPADALIIFYERVLRRRLFSRADRIITSSDFVRDSLGTALRASCTTVTPGVDERLFTPARSRPQGRVLFVSALSRAHEFKGLDTLLETFAALRAGRPYLRLDVVGSGDDVARYRDRCRALGIEDSVRFRGRLSGLELAQAYREATVLALPSRNESFGMVLLEAMASAVPVVATTVGGIPKLIDDGRTGLLVDPGDPEGLAERLVRIIDDPDTAARLGDAGRQEAVRFHTWDRQAYHTNAIFESLVQQQGVFADATPMQKAG